MLHKRISWERSIQNMTVHFPLILQEMRPRQILHQHISWKRSIQGIGLRKKFSVLVSENLVSEKSFRFGKKFPFRKIWSKKISVLV